MRFLRLFIFAFFIGTFSFADTVYLKDDSILKGEVKQADNEKVVIQTNYGLIEIKTDKIYNVIYQHPKKEKRPAPSEPEVFYLEFTGGPGIYLPRKDLDSALSQKSLSGKKDFGAASLLHYAGGINFTTNRNLLLGAGISYWFSSFSEANHTTGREFSTKAGLFYADLKFYFNEVLNGFYFSVSPGVSAIRLSVEGDNYPKTVINSRIGFGIKSGINYNYTLSRFDKALTFGIEGFYLRSQHKNNIAQTTEKWSFSGGHFVIGFIW